MAQKNIKLVGNTGQSKEYWQNAAKQFIWPINFDELHILVPEKDLILAEDNLMVQHFRANGWHIQPVIDVQYTKPYVAPENKGPMFKAFKQEEKQEESKFKCEQRFKVISSDCELKIVRLEKGKVQLHYTNRNKPDLLTSEENLIRALNIGTWKSL